MARLTRTIKKLLADADARTNAVQQRLDTVLRQNESAAGEVERLRGTEQMLTEMIETPVRILRLIEYIGSRYKVEDQVRRSIHGTKDWGNGVSITAITLHEYPEVLDEAHAQPQPPMSALERARELRLKPSGRDSEPRAGTIGGDAVRAGR